MAGGDESRVDHFGPRRSVEWYDQRGDPYPLRPGDRLLLPCEGGPGASRLVTFPPPLELEGRGGTYVLVDDGPRRSWHYCWVPSA